MKPTSTIRRSRLHSPARIVRTPAGLRLQKDETLEAIVTAKGVIVKQRRRAVSPLLALMKLTDGFTRPCKAAGVTTVNKKIPALNLYNAFFPRDAHVVAYFLRDVHPELTDKTVLECFRYTGVKEHLRGPGLKDEQEVGKVPHEIREAEHDPIAIRLSNTQDWGWPYYGAVDTTGKNVNAVVRITRRRGGLAFLKKTYVGLDGLSHTVEEGLAANLNWLRKRMDMNPDGVIESLWINPKNHANQTWIDSVEAFHHADGSWPAHHPLQNRGVAGTELQAETYDALIGAAELYERLSKNASGKRKRHLESEATDLHDRAAKLKQVVLTKFWVVDKAHYGGYFARGTDRDSNGRLRPLAVRSSDMGHLLNSRILDGTDPDVAFKREAVIQNLFSPEMLCPSGIRTLSTDSVRYYKDKYHNGTSWPWVTYYIALGLERHGYYGLARELKKRILSLYESTKLLPEYASGGSDPSERLVTDKIFISDPTAPEKEYSACQPAQEIQAWTAAAVLAIKNETNSGAKKGSAGFRTAADEQKRYFEKHVLQSLDA